jgi:restriction system protein
MSENEYKIRTPLFPPYSWVRSIIRVWDGVPKATIMSMINAIQDQTGTPQSALDWSDPDTWIRERLTGKDAELAKRIWEYGGKIVNPRYTYGSYLFIKNFDLLEPDAQGDYHLTTRGKQFLENDSQLIKEIDDEEGILELIHILATKGEAKRSDLIPDWKEFLKNYSKYGTTSTIKDTLRRRLVNLIDRDLVKREGNVYSLTPKGLEYEKQVANREETLELELRHSIEIFNKKQKETLRDRLSDMNPFKFEHLIRDLLEDMGYEDVIVTQESGDQGVDVIGTVQVGITEVKEVVQVKRRRSNIGRPILDQLRGALPYHNAIRGTLITLGKFSSGCREAAMFPGAQPITLIDGERLLDLLIKHEIGIQKKSVSLIEIDEPFFAETISEKLDPITP